jgi:hypothetical protein
MRPNPARLRASSWAAFVCAGGGGAGLTSCHVAMPISSRWGFRMRQTAHLRQHRPYSAASTRTRRSILGQSVARARRSS